MKAVRYHTPGPPEALLFEDVPTPEPGPGEVLLRVTACAINRIDVWARSGRYKTSLPHVPGTDISGEVVALGTGVPARWKGAPVLVYPTLSDGTCPYCRDGRPNLCANRGFVGVAGDGGYAESVVVPAANLVAADGLDLESAAALPVDFGTAWSGLASKARAGPGDTVLVWGAAGGLGHAAVQIAKLLGAKVIAAVGKESKVNFVRSLGADYVIDSRSKDLVNEVRGATQGLGASVVFDHVGGETWSSSIDCLARGGRMIALGLTSGPKSEVDVRRVYQDELIILGTYGHTTDALRRVADLMKSGALRPSIFRRLPLDSAAEGHRVLESRDVEGKILLIP